jgi:RNA polymerase sigma-70 factor (ECF subfamily)
MAFPPRSRLVDLVASARARSLHTVPDEPGQTERAKQSRPRRAVRMNSEAKERRAADGRVGSAPAVAVSAQALVAIRSDMMRFARLQLGNLETAEDMVQESIEAALRSLASFSGTSSLKTWVFAILKNRIIDHFRQAGRTVTFSSLVEDGEDWQESVEALFNDRGRWRDEIRPVTWPSPEESVQSQQFWTAFETCLEVLPPNTRRVFMMREFLGLESEEICTQLKLTTTNLHVILHRARLKLRGCLENGWVRAGAR